MPVWERILCVSSSVFLDDGSCALFRELASTFFSKILIKTGFYSTIYTFKNYFVTMFSVFSNNKIVFLVKGS